MTTATVLYIGIDDTDVIGSRGTGYLARQLSALLVGLGETESLGVTRHQLLVDPRIPYTSHNSSACIAVRTRRPIEEIVATAAGTLEARAAVGSDPGLCIALRDRVSDAVGGFGDRAKGHIVTAAEARALAIASDIRLSAHGGSGLGIIGALAAVGLRAGGNDGRFLELGGIRNIEGTPTASELRQAGVQAFATGDHRVDMDADERIEVGDWCRPVLLAGVPTLLIEEVPDGRPVRWRSRPREHIRSH